MKRLKRHPESRSLVVKVGVALGVIAVATAGVLIWLVFFTGAFGITTVEVKGNGIRTADYIRQESGAAAYHDIVTLPVGRISEKLEQDPWIRRARVSRRPLHTVIITVEERSPVALLDCKGARFVVDGTGWVIEGAPAGGPVSLPVISGGDMSTPKIGAPIADRRVRDCVTVMSGMSQQLRSSMAMANPFDGRGQVFVSKDGFQVVYGSGSEKARKNEVLEAIMIDARNNGRSTEYIDVRVPDSPVIKLKKPPEYEAPSATGTGV